MRINTLVDTRVNLYTVINLALAIKLCKRFDILIKLLDKPGAVTPYNRKGLTMLTHGIHLDLVIN